MKYTVTYSCGHEEEIQLFGPNKDRERRIAAFESQECPACRAAKAPELTGSAKQVAWAADIKAKGLPDVDENHAAMAVLVDRVVSSKDSAKWWIDHRDFAAHDIEAEVYSLWQARS